ncbi:MAG: DUF167 domain-containing protein [Anaerolineales bacterium]
MKRRDVRLHDGERGSALAIRLIPSASKNEVSKVLKDGTIEVKLVGGSSALNDELKEFLSQLMNVSKKRINVIAGQSQYEKLVSIIDIEPSKVQEIILANIS